MFDLPLQPEVKHAGVAEINWSEPALGCQIVLSNNRHQRAGTALAMKDRAGGHVISHDLLHRVLTGVDGQNALRYINVVDTWGSSGRAYHDEDLRQNH
jgi:hypothetical protein